MPISPGPFVKGSLSRFLVRRKVNENSIAAKEEILRIRDQQGFVVASLPYHNKSSKANQELLIRASNAVMAAAAHLNEEPLKIARLIEDGEIISAVVSSMLEGMNTVFSYMPELKKKFPGQKLFQVPRAELNKAIEQIRREKGKEA